MNKAGLECFFLCCNFFFFGRLMELYSNVVSQSPLLGEQFRKIRRKLDDEIELQQQYVALSGQIETVSTTKRK